MNKASGYSKSSFKQGADRSKLPDVDKSKGDGQVKESEDVVMAVGHSDVSAFQ